MSTRSKTTSLPKSSIPYLAPSSSNHESSTWSMDGDMSIVRVFHEPYVSLTRSGDEIMSLSLAQAMRQGETAYEIASNDSERNWARALCSAASFNVTRK